MLLKSLRANPTVRGRVSESTLYLAAQQRCWQFTWLCASWASASLFLLFPNQVRVPNAAFMLKKTCQQWWLWVTGKPVTAWEVSVQDASVRFWRKPCFQKTRSSSLLIWMHFYHQNRRNSTSPCLALLLYKSFFFYLGLTILLTV